MMEAARNHLCSVPEVGSTTAYPLDEVGIQWLWVQYLYYNLPPPPNTHSQNAIAMFVIDHSFPNIMPETLKIR
jgi:hypothetical protein